MTGKRMMVSLPRAVAKLLIEFLIVDAAKLVNTKSVRVTLTDSVLGNAKLKLSVCRFTIFIRPVTK